jgi:hypothetical protein
MEPLTRYDKCVHCGELTLWPVETSIQERTNYIKGVGQLCDKCYIEIYRSKVNDLSDCG